MIQASGGYPNCYELGLCRHFTKSIENIAMEGGADVASQVIIGPFRAYDVHCSDGCSKYRRSVFASALESMLLKEAKVDQSPRQ